MARMSRSGAPSHSMLKRSVITLAGCEPCVTQQNEQVGQGRLASVQLYEWRFDFDQSESRQHVAGSCQHITFTALRVNFEQRSVRIHIQVLS
jgi:hypothetical protein